MDIYGAKSSDITDRQFKITVQQQTETEFVSFAPFNCFQRSLNSNSPFPLLKVSSPLPLLVSLPLPIPPAAHSPLHPLASAPSMYTAATPSATGSAASCSPAGLSTDVSSHAANSWRCHHDQLSCNSGTSFATCCAEGLYRNLHMPGLSRWFLSRVTFSPVITHESPMAVQACAAVLHSCLAILLRLLPLKLCLFPAALDLPATPPPLPTHYQACGSWCLQQLARPGQARLTQGHTTLLA